MKKQEIQEAILKSLQEFSQHQLNLASEAARLQLSDNLTESIFEILQRELLCKQDEIDSLWLLLDEIREADIKNYADEFQQMLDGKITELKILAMTKPAQA